jgi:dTDP-4-dehydrorhamnose reductase
MTIVIIGKNGQLGQALLASSPADNAVVALDRDALDLALTDQIAPRLIALTPSLIVNASAYTAVDKAESEPELAWRINAAAPAEMVRAARTTGARMIQVSTDFVFDGSARRPIAPDSPPRPLSIYGASKFGGEQAMSAEDLIIRTAWVHAAEGTNFVKTMLRMMAERDVVRVVADQQGSPTWATHLAQAVWDLAAVGASGIHHVTGSGGTSWFGFAQAIREAAIERGLLLPSCAAVEPIGSSDYPTPARRPDYSILDCASSVAAIRRPLPGWHDGLTAMLDELATQASGKRNAKDLSYG